MPDALISPEGTGKTKMGTNDFIVIRKANSEDEEYFITDRNNFEEVNMCDCYDSYGQKNGCYNAGCYSLDNSASDAKKDCLKALYEHFEVEFNDDDCNNEQFDEAIEGTNDLLAYFNIDEIKHFVEQWKAENEYHIEVKAWTYWDGNNYQSILLDFPYSDSVGYETVENWLQDEILEEMPDTPYFDGVSTLIESEHYQFYFTKWTSDPWICRVIMK